MRSPYMDILESLTDKPKAFVFNSQYAAQIARTSVNQLAGRAGIGVNLVKRDNTLIAWLGQIEQVPFTVPRRKFKPRSLAEAQVRWAFGA